jgi:protein-disulfide isomerase
MTHQNKIVASLFLVSVTLSLFIGYFVGSKFPKKTSTAETIVATYDLKGTKKIIQQKDITDRLASDFADQDRMIYQQKKQAILDIVNEEIRKTMDLNRIDLTPPTTDEFDKIVKSLRLDKRKLTERQRSDIMNNLAVGQRNSKIKAAVDEKMKSFNLQLQLDPPFSFVDAKKPGSLLIAGDLNYPVDVLFYGNFHCPQCSQAYQTILSLDSEFTKKLKVHFKYLGLEPDQAIAFKTAKSLYCLTESQKKSGLAAALTKAYFERPPDSMESIAKIVSGLGLDSKEMGLCLDSKTNNSMLRTDAKEGQDLNKTLSSFFIINDYFVPAAEQRVLIEDLLKFILKTK